VESSIERGGSLRRTIRAGAAGRARFSRRLHRALAWIVGLQLLVWTASGLYMTAVPLEFIHGDALVRNLAPPLDVARATLPFDELRRLHPDLQRVVLRARADDAAPVYEITTASGTVLVDAASGATLSPLDATTIAALARAYYAGNGRLASVRRLDADLPGEIRGRRPPVWRADFDDWLATSLYLHPDTGRLLTRRHRFWRWFDLLWSLHIMDYGEREDVNNGLLRVASVLGLAAALSGLWLAVYSFRTRRP
jgi:hypothetical protein